MKKNQPQDSTKLAGRTYSESDYHHKNDTLSAGLATTHEQVSDAYMEGEIGAVLGNINGKDIPIPRKGYSRQE